jgi:RNA 3'-terminal phosphate cyclase (ATP)
MVFYCRDELVPRREGQVGVTAEHVADRVVEEARRYLAAGVPVGKHLADQLMIPLALAGAGAFRTLPLSNHSKTQREIIGKFLERRVMANEVAEGVWQVEAGG